MVSAVGRSESAGATPCVLGVGLGAFGELSPQAEQAPTTAASTAQIADFTTSV
jgi:hypothetical protein